MPELWFEVHGVDGNYLQDEFKQTKHILGLYKECTSSSCTHTGDKTSSVKVRLAAQCHHTEGFLTYHC